MAVQERARGWSGGSQGGSDGGRVRGCRGWGHTHTRLERWKQVREQRWQGAWVPRQGSPNQSLALVRLPLPPKPTPARRRATANPHLHGVVDGRGGVAAQAVRDGLPHVHRKTAEARVARRRTARIDGRQRRVLRRERQTLVQGCVGANARADMAPHSHAPPPHAGSTPPGPSPPLRTSPPPTPTSPAGKRFSPTAGRRPPWCTLRRATGRHVAVRVSGKSIAASGEAGRPNSRRRSGGRAKAHATRARQPCAARTMSCSPVRGPCAEMDVGVAIGGTAGCGEQSWEWGVQPCVGKRGRGGGVRAFVVIAPHPHRRPHPHPRPRRQRPSAPWS
jgi:hypothetical protein